MSTTVAAAAAPRCRARPNCWRGASPLVGDRLSSTLIWRTCDSYCNFLLAKGVRGLEGDALDAALRRAIDVFKLLDDKDVFQKFYSRLLAKRLILGASVSDDAEKLVLSELKLAAGFEYTNKLQVRPVASSAPAA